MGVQKWNRTWGGNEDEKCIGVAIDSSDNIYLAGYTESYEAEHSDMYLVKCDSEGILQWNATWGGSEGDSGSAIVIDSLDNVYVSRAITNQETALSSRSVRKGFYPQRLSRI